MNMKRFTHHVLAAMVIAAWGSACVQEEAPGDEAASEQEAVSVFAPSDEPAAIGSVGQAGMSEEALPGGPSDESTADEQHTAAGCAYVEWCDAPGDKTAVCTRTGGCSCASAWQECYTDVNYVCGKLPDGPIYMNGCGWEW